MRRRWLVNSAICGLLLSPAAWAQGLVEPSYDGRVFRLHIPCRSSGKAVVYALSKPERVVVELPEGPGFREFRLAARSGPRVHLKDLGLSRTQVVVDLDYRVPFSAIKLRSSAENVDLEIATSYEIEDTFALTPGVRWRRREWVRQGEYCLWNELLVDPRDSNVKLEVGLAKDRLDAREKPSAMSARLQGVGAVNGGYFGGSGGPLGVVVRDGKLLAPHVSTRPPRTVLGLMKDGRVEFEQMVAKAGSLASRSGQTWDEVRLALGAGPRLVHRNRIALTTDEEELGPRGNDITRKAARTAVATLKDGKLLIITACGYHDLHRQGLRLEEVAEELVRRGASEAMNLDGGSSTSMSIGQDVVSNGAGAPRLEKEVATALVVVDPRPVRYPSRIRARLDSQHLQADGESEATLTVEVSDGFGKAVPDGTMVRVYPEHCQTRKDSYKLEGGQATIPILSVASCGEGRIRVECGGARQELSFHLDPGPAAKFVYRLTPGAAPKVGDTEQEVALVVHVSDRWGNSVNNVPVTCNDDKGQPLQAGSTGKNGNKTFMLKLPGRGGKVSVQIPGMPPQSVVVPPAASGGEPGKEPVPLRNPVKPDNPGDPVDPMETSPATPGGKTETPPTMPEEP